MSKDSASNTFPADEADLNRLESSGPYIGTVMKNNDPTMMGRLEVWIPELSKKPPNANSSWTTVNYAPPFYGTTNLAPNNSPDATKTTQSYGMWFVPPDIGVQVLVTFVNRDYRQGYWFACVPNQLMNHMIPGIAHRGATVENSLDKKPVTEYDKNAITEYTNPDEIIGDDKTTPPHLYQATILENQGLSGDEARGPSMSTVRRETPTHVFGISTPGYPTARMVEDPTKDFKMFSTVTGRTGGHQFVMDDGDNLGQSRLVKIRSGDGGTVMINDTIGSIYVINQNGSAWVELTANGRIDVYGRGSVSVHSENDLNFTANNDINFLATNNVNVVAATINTEAVDQRHYGKSKMYFRSPDTMMESDSLTLIAKKGVGSNENTASQFGSGLTVQADNGTMQFGTFFKTLAGDDITFETGAKLQVNAAGLITLKTPGKLELDAGGGIYEAAKAGSGTIAQFTADVDTEMKAADTGGDTKDPTGWTGAKNWFEGASTEIQPLEKDLRTTKVVDILKPFSSGTQQSHVPITPQKEPWTAHDVGVSSAASMPPEGLSNGDPLFINGSGVAFPEDTTNIVAGAVDYALSKALATFIGEMNIDFNKFKEDYAATVSRGRYSQMPDGFLMINPNGYVGRYQLGMADLKNLGVTTTDAQDYKTVNENSSWTPITKEILSPAFKNAAIFSPPKTPQFGPASVVGFLLDKPLQEKCFVAVAYSYFLSLKKLGIISGTDKEPSEERAGWLKAAMLMGIGDKGSFAKFAPKMTLNAEQSRQLASGKDQTGNGAIGLYVHWKVQNQSPETHVSRDPAGGSVYKYYAQGSRSQS